MRLPTVLAALLFLGCGASSTLPSDAPERDGGSADDASEPALERGVIYSDCGPADGPAIRGYVIAGTPVCDDMRTTTELPRLAIYAAGPGPRYAVGEDFTQVTRCTADGACEEATGGTLEVDPPMGSMTTFRVDLSFPSGDLSETFIVELCPGDVLCG